MKKILISGASVAGPALAWWLHRRGFRPTLVETMPGPARGGHAVDIRGTALDVLESMGIKSLVHDRRMRLKGISKVDETGAEVWRSEEMTISGGRFDNEDIEILRDRLSRVITEALPPEVGIRCGDSIAALHEASEGVTVSFASGAQARFDLVIGADGLRSNVRRLAFGEDSEFLHSFGIALAPFSAPNLLGIEDWQISYRNAAGDGYMVYTTPDNTELRVCFSVPASLGDGSVGREAQKALVRCHCSGLGWETPKFLEAMDAAPDFYLGLVAQVKMERWNRGRLALVGDAAYCPSPYSGQGTSLALVGAYVLADELARSQQDYGESFARYEDRMRPFVMVNQAIADLTRDHRFTADQDFYSSVIEPAVESAKRAIVL